MAKDFMAQMLDELMGRNRNAAPNERHELGWDDETVCKHHLVNYCPHELFLNTKADMGICKLLHDDNFREQYQNSPKKGKMGYEEEFLRFIRQMVQDVDRRIDRGKGRLESTRQAAQTENMHAKNDERLRELSEKIEVLVQEAGKLGSEGKVEEAQQKLRQSDQLRKDRDGLRQTIEIAIQQEKQLEVCQTCGAFLIVGDAQQRIDDHLAGKQHMGYARIKETLKEEEEKLTKELEERRKARSARGGSRERSERSERSERRDDRSNRRDRSGERSKRRSPSRERSKRNRSRSGSAERRNRRRSRSRENRNRRDRSRERQNGRGGGRRDRSVSRERDSKSRRADRSKERTSKRRSRSRDEAKRRSREDDTNLKRRSTSSSGSSYRVKPEPSKNGNGTKEESPQVPSVDSIHLPENGVGRMSVDGDERD